MRKKYGMVVKTFKEARTPCPKIGTIGEFYEKQGEFIALRFKEFEDNEYGYIWFKEDEDDYYIIRFRADEVELFEI